MEKLNNNAIISRFMKQEIEVIYKKYLKISDNQEELIGNFIRKLEEGKVDFFDPYLNFEKTKSLANVLQDEENIDVIKLYIFLKSDLEMVIDLDDVRYYHEELVDKGYHQMQDYLIYYDFAEQHLAECVEEALVYDLEEPDRATDLFGADELAEMWICGISLEEAAGQVVEDYGWQEAIDIDYLGTAYFDVDNREIFACETYGGGFFD